MAENPDNHHSAPANPPWGNQIFPQHGLRPHQVQLYIPNLSMAQSSPVSMDDYDLQFMPSPASVPSEHVLYDIQPQYMLHDHQLEPMVYASQPWAESMVAQPTQLAPEFCDTANASVVPQNEHLVAEEYPFIVGTRQQAGINATNFLPTHHAAEATPAPTISSTQYLDPQDARLDTDRRVSVPPRSHQQLHSQGIYPHDCYNQPATSPLAQTSPQYLDPQLDPHHRLSAPPTYLSAESSSRPLHLQHIYFHNSTNAPPIPSPHQRHPTSAMVSSARPPSKRSQIQTSPGSHRGLVYVHKRESSDPREVECTYWLPEDYPIRVPEKVRPKEPKVTQDTIRMLRPTIIYGEFQDSLCNGCRTRGICVHFTFLLGARGIPDGLICDRCKANAKEEPIKSNRVCPIHNRRTLSQFLSSLPEDILATAKQQLRAMEFMRRAFTCDWDDVPSTEDTQVVGDLGQMLDSGNNPMGNFELSSSDGDEDSEEDDEDEDTFPRPAKRLKTCKGEGNDSEIEIGINATQSSDTGGQEC